MAFDDEEIMSVRVFTVETLVDGEMLVLETEQLLAMYIGEDLIT